MKTVMRTRLAMHMVTSATEAMPSEYGNAYWTREEAAYQYRRLRFHCAVDRWKKGRWRARSVWSLRHSTSVRMRRRIPRLTYPVRRPLLARPSFRQAAGYPTPRGDPRAGRESSASWWPFAGLRYCSRVLGHPAHQEDWPVTRYMSGSIVRREEIVRDSARVSFLPPSYVNFPLARTTPNARIVIPFSRIVPVACCRGKGTRSADGKRTVGVRNWLHVAASIRDGALQQPRTRNRSPSTSAARPGSRRSLSHDAYNNSSCSGGECASGSGRCAGMRMCSRMWATVACSVMKATIFISAPQ